MTKEYKANVKTDNEDTKFYRDTVQELYNSFLSQGITTLSLKSINNKIKKSLSNQESYKRTYALPSLTIPRRTNQQLEKMNEVSLLSPLSPLPRTSRRRTSSSMASISPPSNLSLSFVFLFPVLSVFLPPVVLSEPHNTPAPSG